MNIPQNSPLTRILKARAANRTNQPKPQPPQPASEAAVPSPKVAEIPLRLRELEPQEPPRVTADDPVFNTRDAAQILGLSTDRLMKWRQRGQGPGFLQYESDGPVRYELSSLIQFKAAHRVRPSRQPHPGRRR
jgi:hypothetical protein